MVDAPVPPRSRSSQHFRASELTAPDGPATLDTRSADRVGQLQTDSGNPGHADPGVVRYSAESTQIQSCPNLRIIREGPKGELPNVDEMNSYETRKVVTSGGPERDHMGNAMLDSTAQHVDITGCYWQLKVGTSALEDWDATAFKCSLVGTGSNSQTLSGTRSDSKCMRRVRTTSTKANTDGRYRARSSASQEGASGFGSSHGRRSALPERDRWAEEPPTKLLNEESTFQRC